MESQLDIHQRYNKEGEFKITYCISIRSSDLLCENPHVQETLFHVWEILPY